MSRCLFLGIQYLVTCNSAWHKTGASCRVDWIIHRCTVGPRSTLLPNPSKDTVVIALRQNNNMCESGRGGNPMTHTQGTENRVEWNEKHLNQKKRGEQISGMSREEKRSMTNEGTRTAWKTNELYETGKQKFKEKQALKQGIKKMRVHSLRKKLSKHWKKWKASASSAVTVSVYYTDAASHHHTTKHPKYHCQQHMAHAFTQLFVCMCVFEPP